MLLLARYSVGELIEERTFTKGVLIYYFLKIISVSSHYFLVRNVVRKENICFCLLN